MRYREHTSRCTHIAALLALAGAFTLDSCGGDTDGGRSQGAVTTIATTSWPVVRARVVAVLEDSTHGPALCTLLAESLPPQCNGIPIVGWDWDQVEDEERVGGTTWVENIEVVGTFDGTSFTVTQPPVPAPTPTPIDPLRSRPVPCPEPDGGWRTLTPEQQSGLAQIDAITYARSQPDLVSLWAATPATASGGVVLVAVFTGDLERHLAELEARWGGSVCVVGGTAAAEPLDQTRQRFLAEAADRYGLTITGTSIDELAQTVDVAVLIADEATITAVAEDYNGLVRLHPLFEETG
ncbi:MAG: hypothetical protein AB7W59_29295 [Acidimicrobiia bacterium]